LLAALKSDAVDSRESVAHTNKLALLSFRISMSFRALASVP
jgi:hypothetical protein